MPTFEVRCKDPASGKPYTIAIDAGTKEIAVKLASKVHTIDPSELPPASPIPIHTADSAAAEFLTAARGCLWAVVGVGILFLLLIVFAVLADALNGRH